MLDLVDARLAFWAATILLVIGLYVLMASRNLVKKVLGLNMFQVAVFVFFPNARWGQGTGGRQSHFVLKARLSTGRPSMRLA